MSTIERAPLGNPEHKPTLGTVKHLEYISRLDIGPGSELWDPDVFLKETGIATTLASCIRRHTTHRPKVMHAYNEKHMTLDSQREQVAADWPQQFSGSIDVYPTIILPQFDSYIEAETFNELIDMGIISMDPLRWPSNIQVQRYSKSVLQIVGHPNPNDAAEDDYRYSIYIPLDDQLFYDPAPERPLETRYAYSNGEEAVYDRSDAAASDHNLVFHSAIKESANVLLDLFHHIYGESNGLPSLKPAESKYVSWRPDYLFDDRDEFMPKKREAPKKYYLDDDPDEFRKKPREQW